MKIQKCERVAAKQHVILMQERISKMQALGQDVSLEVAIMDRLIAKLY